MNTDLWCAAVNQLANNVTFANMKTQIDKMTFFPTTGENTLIDTSKAALYACAALPASARPSWYLPSSPLQSAAVCGPTVTGTDGPYDSSPWTLSVATTTGAQADPLGGTSASKITLATTATSAHKLACSFTGTTFSLFAKAGTAAYIALSFNTFTDYATFKLSDGTVAAHNGTVTYAITPSGVTGWYIITYTASAGTVVSIGFGDTAAHAIATFTAAGTETFFIFQAMGA